MAVNPNGLVMTSDGGTPRTMTGKAREIISGGQFVGASGAAGALAGSDASDFTWDDVEVYKSAAGADVVGIALADAASGAEIAFATRGVVLVPVAAGSAVEAGQICKPGGDGEILPILSGTAMQFDLSQAIGRALVSASGGEYTALNLNI